MPFKLNRIKYVNHSIGCDIYKVINGIVCAWVWSFSRIFNRIILRLHFRERIWSLTEGERSIERGAK